MKTGTTSSGFAYSLEDDVLDDYELLEMLCEIDEGKNSLIIKVAKQLLGEKQLESLKEHVRNEKGKVSVLKMSEEISQILNGDEEGKNL